MPRASRLAALALLASPVALGAQSRQPTLGSRSAPELTVGGLRFRDLNRNGALDPYEDWRLTPEARTRDLLGRMTLEEKAGTMMHGSARSLGPMGVAGAGSAYDLDANRAAIRERGITSLITRLSGAPELLAAQNNQLQEVAEGGRLGIPVTVSTDPRHHFQAVFGASDTTRGFSRWPETLGLAATRDPALVRQFGDIARGEYRAAGIQMALSPQADLATEPRWARTTGTFGEDPVLVGQLVRAYVEGFQHGARGVDARGVATVVKHWVGYGAAKDGYDSHNRYGRYATFPTGDLTTHIAPFLPAFAAQVAAVMPTYSILEGAKVDGQPVEAVGAGYSAQLLTGLLRGKYGFRGLILSDWLITGDCDAACTDGTPPGTRPSFRGLGMPWGVESLDQQARFVKAVRAGVDQFGGVEEPQHLVAAVRAGQLTEARLDSSVARILVDKFRLGLFENPYVDVEAARTVGNAASTRAARAAQRRSLVLLENEKQVLPIKRGARVYLRGIAAAAATQLGLRVVDDPRQADVAVVRMEAPFEVLHPGYMFGSMQHEGRLDYPDSSRARQALAALAAQVPTVATVYLDRAAVLTALKGTVRGLVANFGVEDGVLLEALMSRAPFTGRLPFELPSSMEAVAGQRSDLPHDSAKPLYPIGFGRGR